MENKMNTLASTFYDMLAECNTLSSDLCRKENMSDGCLLKEIHYRMEHIHYKAEVVSEFIKILKAAELGNLDLGDEINAAVSFYYANFIMDLNIEMEGSRPHYFADMKCFNFFENWKKLCRHYKDCFVKNIDLPKSIDLSPYYLAMEIME